MQEKPYESSWVYLFEMLLNQNGCEDIIHKIKLQYLKLTA